MKSVLAVSLIVAALGACGSAVTIDPPTPASLELDICEAVFRHQFLHNASAVQQDAAAYFLSIRENDPSPEFLARFTGNQPPVLPGSGFEIGKGLRFRVDTIEWQDDGSVKVTGGYFEAGLSSSGNVYTLEPVDDAWEVTADEMEWIS